MTQRTSEELLSHGCPTDKHRSPRVFLLSKTICSSNFQQKFERAVDEAMANNAGVTRSIAMLATASMVPKSTTTSSSRVPGLNHRWVTALERARTVKAATGLPVHVIDCAEKDRVAECMRVLERSACIWIGGGNTFYLWYWMKKSGAHELIKRRVLHGGAVYVGRSAGAIVAGRSIRTAFWKGFDNPRAAPCEWEAKGACDGMNLTPMHTSIFPHYGPEWKHTVDKRRSELGHHCLTLTDYGMHAGLFVTRKGKMQMLANVHPSVVRDQSIRIK